MSVKKLLSQFLRYMNVRYPSIHFCFAKTLRTNGRVVLKKFLLSPFALSVRRKTNVSKGTGYSKLLMRLFFAEPILRYIFALQKHSGRTVQIPLFLMLFASHISLCYYQIRPITVMINPAGDAQRTGRKIDDSFERGITLQYAEQLKKVIEATYPQISVILTRFPGDMVNPLQHANFANRLNVDLYLSVHFYHEKGIKPNLYIYRFSYNDDFMVPSQSLAFYSYDQAHLGSSKKTATWSEQIKQIITQPAYAKQFNVHGVYKLPFAPLIGIKAPAIGIEASLKSKDDWHVYIDPIVACVGSIVRA